MVHAIAHARVYVAHLLRMSMVHAIAHARVYVAHLLRMSMVHESSFKIKQLPIILSRISQQEYLYQYVCLEQLTSVCVCLRCLQLISQEWSPRLSWFSLPWQQVSVRYFCTLQETSLLIILSSWDNNVYSGSSDSGPSDEGTQYNRPLYKGHRLSSQKFVSL